MSSPPSPPPAKRRRVALLIGTLSRLPLPLLYAIAGLLHGVLYHVLRFQRKLLFDNLRRAFPDRSAVDIRQLAAASYRNALDFLVETLKAWRMNASDLQRRVAIDNPQLLQALLRDHKTVIALTAHNGNWEWLHLACAATLNAPVAAVYNPLNHPGVDALLLEMRSRFGSRLIDSGNALPQLVQFSRQGGIVALNADQLPRPEDDKYWSRFLGIDTAFFTGPEKLARLFQAPVVFVGMQRVRRGYYRIHFERLCAPPYPATEGVVMQPYVQAVERQILAAPQDWFWLYKRWKYRKPMYADRSA